MPETLLNYNFENISEFYFFYDEELKLPSTIPMDLATLFIFLKNKNLNFNDFKIEYNLINNTQNCNRILDATPNLVEFINAQINDCGSLLRFNFLKDEIALCKNFLDQEESNDNLFTLFLENSLPKAKHEFRTIDYYSSLKQLYIVSTRIIENNEEDDLPF